MKEQKIIPNLKVSLRKQWLKIYVAAFVLERNKLKT
jgi:hypothetical protein